MFTIIPKSYIPIESKKTFKTKKDNQNKFNLWSKSLKDNVQLLNIVIDIHPLLAGTIKIDVCFSNDIRIQ